MKKLFISSLASLILLAISSTTFGQLDTKHYIPPMFGREDQGSHYIVLSTPSTIPFDVTITDGAGTIITTQTISSASSSTYFLGTGNATQFLVDEADLNTVLADEGLILTGNYPFYVNIRVLAGPQAGSLTSKGQKAALGKDFRTGHLYNNDGDDWRKSNVFSIMATEDNTTVTIDDIRPGVIFRGTTPTGSPLTSPNVTVVLNQGETYVVAAFFDEAGAIENVNGVNGTHISSDKDIVVNTGSWLGGNALVGGVPAAGRDLGIDQIVPFDLIGTEYVAIKGEGIDNEKIIVVGAVDNTDIMLDGVATPVATINAGDYYVIDVTAYSANENLYIESSQPVFVYQTANGSDGTVDDNERQCGLNFLPPIGCSGSKSVLLPEVDFIGTAYINIIANAGATVWVDGVPLGPGDAVTGTSSYVTYKLTTAFSGDVEITSDDLTRVALINLSGNVGSAGYFSGFTKDITVQTQTINGDDIALEGCISASFDFCIDGPSTTDTEITYQVLGTATNGIDYQYIDSMITIPAGQTCGTVFINSISDGIPEGQETVYIIFQPDACSPVDTAVLFIDDAQPIEFTTDGTDLNCFDDNSGQIDVSATGGFPPYTYYITTDAGAGTTTTYSSVPVTGLPSGTYSVQVYDVYGCKADALVIGGMYDADTTFLPDGNGDTYTTSINIAGFGSGATLDNMSQLQQICATMEHSYLGDLEIKIVAPSGQQVILKQYPGGGSCDLGEPFASGPVDGSNSTLTDPGVGFEYCWNATPTYGTMVAESGNYTHTIPASTSGTYTDNYLPAGSYTSFENLDGLLGATLDGDWTLEVTDNLGLDNGYIFNWNISLVSDLPDTLVTIVEPNEIVINGFVTQANCGGNDGAIDVTINGDFPPYTYNWSSGQTTEDISGIPAGTYTLYVSDSNGCTDSMTFILNNISSMNITTNVTNVTCPGGSDGSIDLTTSGGTSPYSWSWSGGQTTEDISGLMAGTHTVTITDNNGCIFSQNITVNTLPAITISLNSSTNEICSQTNGAINVNVSGGTGSYGYDWDNGAITEDISNIGAGTYILTVTDANGCSANNSFSIINDVSNCSAYCYLNIVEEAIIDENCGDGTGSIDITVMDATVPYNISWSTGATTDDISGLNAGTYTVTILDANQCELIEDLYVGNNTGTLNVTSYSLINENCGNDDGAIDITVSGGTAPYTFSWSSGQTTEDISGLAAGTYDVTITDNLGCEFTASYTLDNNTGTLGESAVVTNEICNNNGGNINLTVTGGTSPYSYLWNTSSTSQDITGLSAGTYSVTITDAAGCELQSADYTVLNNAGTLTILSTSITNEVCGDGTGAIDIEILGGNAPFTYAWDSGPTTQDLTGLSTGAYSCTITDVNGCEVSTGLINIFSEAGTLVASTNIITDEVCGDGTGAIDVDITGGTGPYIYSWDSGQSTEDINGLSEGTYILTVTDAGGCMTMLTESVNNLSPGFSVAVTSVTNESCGDGTGAVNITLTGGTGPFTYAWSDGSTSQDLSNVNAGTYDVTITDNNGCTLMTSATVGGAGINIVSAAISDEICGNLSGSIDITFTGGQNPYTFNWSSGGTTEDLTGLSAGNYNLTITDLNGCTANGSYTVGNNTNGLSVVSTVVTDENCGDGMGAIDVTISGGASPISYDWSSGQTTEDLSGISAGNYNLIIEDINGCIVTTSGTVINNSAGFVASINTITDENCGDASGAINIDVAGGTPPYLFAWDSGQTTEDISGLSAGDYTVTITDNNGCIITLTGTVLNNTGTLTIANEVIGNADCMTPTGFIDLTINGGSTPYTFAWSNSATTEDIAGLSSGTYTCVITDNSGCVLNYSGTVSNSGGGMSTDVVITNENCGNGDGSIVVEVIGGISPFTYSWTGATPSSCCDYTLDMSDLGNSWNGASITVLIDGSSIGDFTVPGGGANVETFPVCDGQSVELFWNSGAFDNEVSFDLLDASGTPIFSQGANPTPGIIYTTTGSCPSGPNNVTQVSGLSAGTYDLTITDNVGCEVTESYTILDINTVQINITSVTDEFCGNSNAEITYTVTGAALPWSTTANGFTDGAPVGILSNLYQDTWEIITTDANGCKDTVYVDILNNASFVPSYTSIDESCGDMTGSIDLTLTGGGPNFIYDWDNGSTTQDLSGLSAGTYICTIYDQDNGNCEDQVTVVINNSVDFTASTVVVDESCGDGMGSIDLTVSGATDLTFAWSNGASTEDISGLSAGNYTCTIINNVTGCGDVISVDVLNVTTGLAATATVTDEWCNDNSGAVNLTVTGGVGPYTYSWSNGASTEDISGLNEGTYTVTVTDQNDGCQITQSYTVIMDGFLNIITNAVVNETCGQSNGSIDISLTGPGSGGATYLWSNGATTQDLSGLSTGTYTVEATNTWGCTSNMTFTIVNSSDITVAASFTNESCGGTNGSIDLTVGGSTDLSYNWSTGATTEDISGLSAGTYTCTVTNNTTGCAEIVDVVLINDNTPDITLSVTVTDENCGDGSGAIDLTVTGSTDLTYAWNNGSSSEDLSGLNAGSYTCTVINNASGCADVITVNVQNITTGVSLSASVTDEWCDDNAGAIDLTVSGGVGPYTYSWSNGATTEDISGLNMGSYTVIVTDQNDGCQVSATYDVIMDGLLNIITDAVVNETCGQSDGSINISVSGSGSAGATYSWSNGATTQDVSGLSAGTYTLIATNSFGCSVSETFTILNSADITVAASFIDENCTLSNGSVDLTVGGSSDVSFVWSTGATTEDLTGISAGTYTCTVTNNTTGCSENVTVTIINNATPDISVTGIVTDESCGDGMGAIDISVTGSTDLTFDWDNGATTEDISGLSEGTYSVTVTNNISGCQATETYTISNVTNGMSAAGIVTDDLCSRDEGAVDLTVSGGVGPYSYSWSNGATTEDLLNVGAGNYSVTITDDSDGCQMTLDFTVGNSQNFTVSGTVMNSSCATCTTGSIDITINETVADGPYTFSWSNGETTEDISNLTPGVYTVIVTGVSGCTYTIDFTVGDNDDVGISSNPNEWIIDLYPNPAINQVTLNYNFYNEDEVVMTITNALGQVVLVRSIENKYGILEMDVEAFSSGIYTVQFSSTSGKKSVRLVISR